MRYTVLLLLIVALAGCGGGGGGGTAANEFSGVWSGRYDDEGWQTSALGFTVQPGGEYSGVITNHATEETGVIAGTIAPDGDLTGTITYPDKVRQVTGNVRIEDGIMVGSWIISNNGVAVESGTIEVEK